ncbi:MAG: hypothetical protein ABI137_00750 [Antricoccus sp.]
MLVRRRGNRAGGSCAVFFEHLARLIVAGLDGLILQYFCDPDDHRSNRDLQVFIDLAIPRVPASANLAGVYFRATSAKTVCGTEWWESWTPSKV